ncbi:thiamine phosphate synthase [Desulfurobacterium atlanticum]|uniref:Thiamine-phosphate synthase n=1 Tax=Desulfurobacterium atlanticum TaxID=240169 RepID=A0A238XMD4_9BACT|nr:thiamine phosphate synthase [Desulfurobacterium atlanticum]SNR60125.1 thiamine-phosphate pyrophosphorylase [Desulfurobacterium atlanticum]
MDLRLYGITDERFMGLKDIAEKVAAAIEGGVTVIQYRAKKKEAIDMYEEALKVREITKKYHIPFIVNDRVDLAIAVGADGVHVGQKDLPVSVVRKMVGESFIVGLSTHNLLEVERADRENVNYIGFGPIFLTNTKEKPDPVVGTKLLKEAVSVSTHPVVAIGGINSDNIREVLECKPAGVSVVRGIFQGDPYENAKKLREIIDAEMG